MDLTTRSASNNARLTASAHSIEVHLSPEPTSRRNNADEEGSNQTDPIVLSSGAPNNDENDGNEDAESSSNVISLDSLKYGYSSFHAICTPVSITMILSALAVTYIQSSPSARSAQETEITGFYTVFDVGGDSSNTTAQNFGMSLLNGLIIICVIAAATFLIVLLYKYRCMKILLGYMVIASASLLGLLGGVMFQTFIQAYGVLMDQLTFYVLIVNFAIVGTIAIFYAKGIPSYVTQAYLVLTSVILAWQLSFFDDWTAWTLLVLLALYDLCAVLTPCGPLKALVNLMMKDDAPEMPGLLYEARLPSGVQRPGRRGGSGAAETNTNASGNTEGDDAARTQSDTRSSGRNEISNATANGGSDVRQLQSRKSDHPSLTASPAAQETPVAENNTLLSQNEHNSPPLERPQPTPSDAYIPAVLPFAIAKIYKLPILPQDCPQFVLDKYRPRADPPVRASYTVSELMTQVNTVFPRNGGRIVVNRPDGNLSSSQPRWRRRDNGEKLPRYTVLDRNGEVKRVLVLNENGKVFQEMSGPRGESNSEREGESFGERNSIKLGLGDFIFYSVLVAKAALNSFTTFAACMLVILAGLGGTLVLLSVYKAALPALPISIFLGVIFYFVTKILIEPWVETILTVPYYV